jgi:hypothetical protein
MQFTKFFILMWRTEHSIWVGGIQNEWNCTPPAPQTSVIYFLSVAKARTHVQFKLKHVHIYVLLLPSCWHSGETPIPARTKKTQVSRKKQIVKISNSDLDLCYISWIALQTFKDKRIYPPLISFLALHQKRNSLSWLLYRSDPSLLIRKPLSSTSACGQFIRCLHIQHAMP